MVEEVSKSPYPRIEASVEDLYRILEVGRLLLSVLTLEELEELGALCGLSPSNSLPVDLLSPHVIGNTGVT